MRPFRIEQLMKKRSLNYFRAGDRSGCWLLPFAENCVFLLLDTPGQSLLLRSAPIIDLSKLTVPEKAAWWQAALAKNDTIRFGRFVGNESLRFEISIFIPEGKTISEEEFHSALSCVVGTHATAKGMLEEIMETLPPIRDFTKDALRQIFFRDRPGTN